MTNIIHDKFKDKILEMPEYKYGVNKINDLIQSLKGVNDEFSKILNHRLNEVTWTTREELFIELEKVINGQNLNLLPEKIKDNVEQILVWLKK